MIHMKAVGCFIVEISGWSGTETESGCFHVNYACGGKLYEPISGSFMSISAAVQKLLTFSCVYIYLNPK